MKVQIVEVTPVHQMFHLLPVRQLVFVPNEALNCCVVCILKDVICIKSHTTFMGHQRQE